MCGILVDRSISHEIPGPVNFIGKIIPYTSRLPTGRGVLLKTGLK